MRRSNAYVVNLTLVYLATLPIDVRIHATYWNDGKKALAILYIAIVTFMIDLSYVPICRLNSRFKSLFRVLWNLQANLDQLERMFEAINWPPVFYGHTICLLRKQLSHSQATLERMSYSGLFFDMNYANLLWLHFWLGLIVISTAFSKADPIMTGLFGKDVKLF